MKRFQKEGEMFCKLQELRRDSKKIKLCFYGHAPSIETQAPHMKGEDNVALVTKKNAKVGLKIFLCYDNRPLNGFGYNRGIITSVCDDHYLYSDTDLGIDEVWGVYNTSAETDNVAVFTTEKETKKWLELVREE